MAKYLMGIDNGGTVCKAALFTLDGKEVAVASQKVQNINQTEMDMNQTWASTCGAIKGVIDKAGIAAAEIACIAAAGHGNGIYLVDADGNPVRNAIYSSDSRARSYIEQWAADGVDRKIRPKTTQCIWPAQPNALLRWLEDNEPETIEKTKWVFMCKDFLRFKLTGEAYAELTDMSGTSLMNVVTGEYDEEVMAAWGLAHMQDKLPPLCKSADVAGKVTAEAAAATGLAEGTPVAGGMFDIDACGLSSAITDQSQLCMILGTWGNNQYVTPNPVIEDVFMTSCYAIPGLYLILEGSATSASNLEWFIAQFLGAEANAAEADGKSVYDVVNDLVASSDPAASNVIYLPFLYGSNVNPDAKGTLIGLTDAHTQGDVLRAVYEGVVFGHMTHMERLLTFREMPERIRLSGGAARSEVWVQIVADVFQCPVEIPDGTELGALGAAICAGVACGEYDSYQGAIDAMVRFARVQEPNADLADLYKAKYARYKKVIEALDGVWADLA